MTAADLPQDVLTYVPARPTVVVLFRCTECGLVGEDARQPYPVCMCFRKHDTLVFVGGPRGCTCGRCVVDDSMRVIFCSGASAAAANREMG